MSMVEVESGKKYRRELAEMDETAIARAKELRAQQWGWKKIGDEIGVSWSLVRRTIDPGYRDREIKRQQYYRDNPQRRSWRQEEDLKSLHQGRLAAGVVEERIIPPDHVIEDRECRLSLVPRDLTAALMNDPLPGYSALDKRQEA